MQGFFLQAGTDNPQLTVLKDTLTSNVTTTREYEGLFKFEFESHINVNKLHLKIEAQGDDGATPILTALTYDSSVNAIYLRCMDITGAAKDNIGFINGCPFEIEYFG